MIAIAPTSETAMTYEEALLYCTFCHHGGYRDWRMPTLSEFHAHSTIYGWTIMSHPVDSMYTWLWITPVRDI